MNVLYIGGTGNISLSSVEKALNDNLEMHLLTRGRSTDPPPEGARIIRADINNPEQVERALKGMQFDAVVNWIAFTPEDIHRDFRLFSERTRHYIFISSASVYQKPLTHPVITESTPLSNPYWDYSRDKIACEELLNRYYREEGFPATIVRPSHTCRNVIPAAVGSWTDFTLIDRIRRGLPVIVHGDGTSLWTIMHSEDFARGFNGLLGNHQAIGHSFHITSDEILTWNQIYRIMGEAAGEEPQLIHVASETICRVADTLGMDFMRGNLLGDKAHSVIFDNTKIKRFVPGFSAEVPFRETIQRAIDWFEADPSRKTISADNERLLDTILDSYRIS